MSFGGDVLVDLAILIDQLDGAICESDCEEVAGALAEGHPVMIDCVAVQFQPLGGLASVHVPSVDDIIVADTE